MEENIITGKINIELDYLELLGCDINNKDFYPNKNAIFFCKDITNGGYFFCQREGDALSYIWLDGNTLESFIIQKCKNNETGQIAEQFRIFQEEWRSDMQKLSEVIGNEVSRLVNAGRIFKSELMEELGKLSQIKEQIVSLSRSTGVSESTLLDIIRTINK